MNETCTGTQALEIRLCNSTHSRPSKSLHASSLLVWLASSSSLDKGHQELGAFVHGGPNNCLRLVVDYAVLIDFESPQTHATLRLKSSNSSMLSIFGASYWWHKLRDTRESQCKTSANPALFPQALLALPHSTGAAFWFSCRNRIGTPYTHSLRFC